MSSVHAEVFSPTVGSSRKEGLIAATPQKAAGRITEPAGLGAHGKRHQSRRDRSGQPEDDPPGVCPASWGLRVGAGSMKAKAVVSVLPTTVAPAIFAIDTIAASALGRQPP